MSIAFNPVQNVPIVLTAGVFDANGAVVSLPSLYRFILANGTEVFQATTNITDAPPLKVELFSANELCFLQVILLPRRP